MLTVATDLCVGLDGPPWGWTALSKMMVGCCPHPSSPSEPAREQQWIQHCTAAWHKHCCERNTKTSFWIWDRIAHVAYWSTVHARTQTVGAGILSANMERLQHRCYFPLWLSQRTKMSQWLNSCHHYTSVPVFQQRGRRVCPLVILQKHVAQTIIIMTHLHRNSILQGPQLTLPWCVRCLCCEDGPWVWGCSEMPQTESLTSI